MEVQQEDIWQTSQRSFFTFNCFTDTIYLTVHDVIQWILFGGPKDNKKKTISGFWLTAKSEDAGITLVEYCPVSNDIEPC